jgi:sugar/nucleoside kinase (ribokinase family)
VDTLGAGDAWVAGFLAGLLAGWPLEKTARVANAVGACCVEAVGATTGVRSLAETLARLEAVPPAAPTSDSNAGSEEKRAVTKCDG